MGQGFVEGLEVVPGRLELVPNEKGLAVVVDYAHTPDALLKALETLSPLTTARLITVFGCGGDRDQGKRYEMGLTVGENTDWAVITSDNPRSEDPMSIIEQAERGTRASGLRRVDRIEDVRPGERGYLVEADRRKAIRMAVALAGPEDMVLIAGKGHEDYQILGAERRHFDDREEAALAAAGGG